MAFIFIDKLLRKKMRYTFPDENGKFGQYGGRLVPPILERKLGQLKETYIRLKHDDKFKNELEKLYREFVGRPSLLYEAASLVPKDSKARVYLKREDLNHTGAHKINNTVGQALVAKFLRKKRLIAETGAGQHGVAVATVAAKFGMKATIYMGARDVKNQKMNVYRMKLLGASVQTVTRGQGTLKDAIDEALEAYVNDGNSFYMLGSAVGPDPYPLMVRDFQAVIGKEVKTELLQKLGQLPDYVVACVGGGSNALGLFYSFIRDEKVKLVAVEPAGRGVSTKKHGMSLMKGKPGDIHGFRCRVLVDENGEVTESYSAASGLDYPGVSPELSYLYDIGRLEVEGIDDKEAVIAVVQLSRNEGIIPALESAHALAYVSKLVKRLDDEVVVVNLSGRGDKDVENIYENLLKDRT